MENKKEMRQWLDNFGLDHPLVIGGPCRDRKSVV